MRASIVLAFLVGITSGAAQAQTPDPTDPARYYPLDIGNVWEYEERFGQDTPSDTHIEIVRDTVIDGREYVIESYSSATPGEPFTDFFETPVRFDSLTSTAVRWYNNSDWHFSPWNGACAFDAPFGPSLDCQGQSLDVRGGLDATFTLSDSTRIQVAALKAYASPAPASDVFDTYAADIGYVRLNDNLHGGETRLRYARIRGVEYGTPFFVSTEAPPPDTGLDLRTRGRSLVIAARDAGPIRVELFDTLGRRVATLLDARLGAQARTLTLPALPSGLYIARAVQGTSRASARIVVTR